MDIWGHGPSDGYSEIFIVDSLEDATAALAEGEIVWYKTDDGVMASPWMPYSD